MNKTIISIIAVLLVALGAYAYSSTQDKAAMEEQKMMAAEKEMMEKEAMAEVEMMKKEEMMSDEEDMMKKDESMIEDKDMMKKDEAVMMDKAEAEMEDKKEMMKSGVYESYSADKLMRAETGDVVLFFHASWCPSCRGLSANIESNLAGIPAGVSILKVDYDTETELKKKYGVTSQHTLVQVDKDGNLIAKWSGSPSLDKLLMEVQ